MDRRTAMGCVLGLLLAAVAPRPASAVEMQVSIARRGDLLLIDAVMVAPVSRREAWDVLTDFDEMTRYVTNLDVSRVVSREGGVLRVEQRGVARWVFFSVPFAMVRDIELQPMDAVRSRLISGTLREARSVTRFTTVGEATEIRHHIELGIDTWLPDVLIEPFLRYEMREHFASMLAEIQRRRSTGSR